MRWLPRRRIRMARVLSLCTYPVAVPRHGGQVRVNAIQQIYRAHGHEVRHLALYRADEYPDEPSSDWNIHFSWPFINALLSSGGRTDLNAPDFLLRDVEACDRVLALIRGFEPDIIQLEHCWMWPVIKQLRSASERFRGTPIVYSSQNVEHSLIGETVSRGAAPVSASTVSLVGELEMDLVANADLVIAVNEADAAIFRTTARQLAIAPNGIWPRGPVGGLEYWSKELRGRRTALFVGSAHPPNASGFMNMLGPTLGFLSPTEAIVVVGGVCNLLRIDPAFRANIGINLARSILVGAQDQGGLSTLIEQAEVILAPITEGGGTNIKMAEALYNRKLVICTPKAVRGYEAFLDMPFMLVRETAAEFRDTLTKVLRGGFDTRPTLNRRQAERLNSLLWSATLSTLGGEIDDLVAGHRKVFLRQD